MRLYFEASYRLLLDSASGRAFIDGAKPVGMPATHGYLTGDDLDTHLAALDQRVGRGDTVLDLGCGFGEVAQEVHRRSGARIVGIDGASRAIAEARRAAARAGVEGEVRFEQGDLARPPSSLPHLIRHNGMASCSVPIGRRSRVPLVTESDSVTPRCSSSPPVTAA